LPQRYAVGVPVDSKVREILKVAEAESEADVVTVAEVDEEREGLGVNEEVTVVVGENETVWVRVGVIDGVCVDEIETVEVVLKETESGWSSCQ